MRIADMIVKILEKNKVKHVYGMSAGTVSAIYDALNDSDITPIMVKNEAASTYSAARYASISGKLGVSIVAGGIGLNNAINGIADAYRCKAPVLIISGYVNRWQIGKGAVQELDTELITKPITKYSKTILSEEDVLVELQKAINIALTPPYGPVHISVPIDVQIIKCDEIMADVEDIVEEKPQYDDAGLINAIKLINETEKGLIMVGKGARGLSNEVKELSRKLKWPIVTTPEGKGVVDSEFEYNLGNYGFCSSDFSVEYIENYKFDCVLILGTSLGESATRNFNTALFDNRKVIHIDWDEKELGKVFDTYINVLYDLTEAIPLINSNVLEKDNEFIKPQINSEYVCNHTGLSTRLFLERVVDIVPKNTYFISDIGEYMNFVFKYLPLKEEMDFDISLNYGAMGSGVAGVMGAYLTDPNRPYAVIVGDGAFFMNGTEIITAKENKMPIIYFVINNSMLGYVQHGHSFLYGRGMDCFINQRVSISEMAQALGIKSVQVTDISQLDKLKDTLSNLSEPFLVELITDGSEKVPAADRFKALSNK